MAENEPNQDEYQLADLDGISPESLNEQATPESNPQQQTTDKPEATQGEKLRRNIVIVIAAIIFLFIVYKFFSSPSEPVYPDTPPAVKTTPPIPKVNIEPTPQVPSIQTTQAVNEVEDKLSQKLSALELTQQSMQTDMTSVTSQLNNLNNNVNDLMTKLADLNRALINLSTTAEAQSREIERLISLKKKPVVKIKVSPQAPPPLYYIQAIIPGRAWIMAVNGGTLTVRKGTPVPGYGKVSAIDPIQGLVMTSTGRIIKFSQEDS